MGESARDLIAQMVSAGEWPDPRLLDRILALGEEAIEPLSEVLRRAPAPHPESEPVWFAARLLCTLRASAAIPDIMNVLRRFDRTEHGFAFADLAFLGPTIIDPLLGASEDPELSHETRAMLLLGAVLVAKSHPAAREGVELRLLARLRPMLESARAGREQEAPTGDESEEVGRLLDNLYFLDAARARAVAREALALGAIDRDELKALETLHAVDKQGGTASLPGDWLADYREAYEEHTQYLAASRRLILLDAADFGREFGREAAQRQLDERRRMAG